MNNIEKYLSLLGEEVDGLLLTSRYSRHYGAMFDIAEGVAIVTAKGCRYFTDSRYIESAQNGIQGFQVIQTDRDHPYTQLLDQAIKDFGVTRLGYEEGYLTVAEHRRYDEALDVALVPYHEKIAGFRAVKEEYELQRMRKAQQITDAAFKEVLGRICVGMTEKELAAELIYCLLKTVGKGCLLTRSWSPAPTPVCPMGSPATGG